MKRFRVAIVEPSLIIAEGVRSMLSVSEYEVVAVVSDVAALLERFAVIEPDVVIVNTSPLTTSFGDSNKITAVDVKAVPSYTLVA